MAVVHSDEFTAVNLDSVRKQVGAVINALVGLHPMAKDGIKP
jgi:hypothetical protein